MYMRIKKNIRIKLYIVISNKICPLRISILDIEKKTNARQ